MVLRNPHLTDTDQAIEAATRWQRFLARVVDTFIWAAPLPLVFFPCLGPLAALALLVGILIGQIGLLVTRGQTFGKKALGIYIMRGDGDIPNIGWLLLREFAIPFAVGVLRFGGRNDPWAIGHAFQILLGFTWVIDGLFIFGPTRRCLHDFVAGTHVDRAE